MLPCASVILSPSIAAVLRCVSRRLCSTMAPSNRLIWIDLEMTGLNPDSDAIIEAACIVTDGDLKTVEPGVNLVIHQPEHVLSTMGAWCRENHGRSGLTEAVRRSQLTLDEAERRLLEYVTRLTPAGECPLAGSSVHMDRVFMARHMPKLVRHLHYRIVDVSSLKELARRWRPDVYEASRGKRCSHRALEDIEDSIQELRMYRERFIKAQE